MAKIKNPYWKRVREARRWQEEQRQTPEERAVHKADWVERQRGRRRQEQAREARRRVAARHTLGQAMLDAGIL
jgi:poly(3-hydroxyalkanoate) synthetase